MEHPSQNRTTRVPSLELTSATYSCVAARNRNSGRIEILPNDQGNRITPSYVAFSPTKAAHRLVGDAAKNQAAINPSHTVFDAKRLIGREYSDASVQQNKKMLPFHIVPGKQGQPIIHLEHTDGDTKTSSSFAPEEISAMILHKMKQTAEDYLGTEVNRAVITVPAYFNNNQREATMNAGKIAGLKVERIINEPTAAAMAFGVDKKQQGKGEEMNVLVFDLGGGTFDVSLVNVDDGFFDVLATAGDTRLGGQDFDQRVMDYFLKKIGRANSGVDFSKNNQSLQKLRMEVERAKRALSTQQVTRVEIENLADGFDLSETLTRARFEEINADLFQKTLKPIDQVLKDSGLGKEEIDSVVLVGGSTRIPKIQELVEKYFDHRPGILSKGDVHVDEAVAMGAGILGSILMGDDTVHEEIVLVDVASLSKGIETAGGVMTKIIERGTKVPTKKTQTFSTQHDNQDKVTIQIFEGERAMTKDNHLLGRFELSGLPLAPRGVPQIEVTFSIDAGGLLQVSAIDKGTGNSKNVTINSENGRLSSEEIEAMREEALRFEEEDRLQKERVDAKNGLEAYLYGVKNSIEETGMNERLSADEKVELSDAIDEALDWFEENPDASADDYNERKREVEQIAVPVMKHAYSRASAENEDDEDFFGDEEL